MSSGFITETEVAEARKKRQEEWEKVRTEDQPLERPEEPYDSRPLYDRLKEQRLKKELEYEEAHKLKNLIRGLDDDEVEFLDLVDRTKMKAELQQHIEEEKELKEFRQRVATLQEQSMDNKIQTETSKTKSKTPITTSRTSQKSLLGGVLRKRKNGEVENGVVPSKCQKEDGTKKSIEEAANCTQQKPESLADVSKILDRGALKCIAILPGIGRYKESSDSEISSDSDDDVDQPGKFDLTGREKLIKKKCGDSD